MEKKTSLNGITVYYTGQINEGRIKKDSPKTKESLGTIISQDEGGEVYFSLSKKKVTLVRSKTERDEEKNTDYHTTITVDGVPFDGIV